jgi:hypothetical protein
MVSSPVWGLTVKVLSSALHSGLPTPVMSWVYQRQDLRESVGDLSDYRRDKVVKSKIQTSFVSNPVLGSWQHISTQIEIQGWGFQPDLCLADSISLTVPSLIPSLEPHTRPPAGG